MLVVLAILGVALGLLAFRGAWHSDRVEVRATAETIADALRLARARAFRDDRTAWCLIDPKRHLVAVGSAIRLRLPRRVAVSSAGAIGFGPDGAGDGATIRVSEGAAARTVSVDWLSGRVTEGGESGR